MPPGLQVHRGEQGGSSTYFLHRCVQREEALSGEVGPSSLHHLPDFRDHVTGNKAKPGTGFRWVESISAFVTIHLESWEEGKTLGGGWFRNRSALLPRVTVSQTLTRKIAKPGHKRVAITAPFFILKKICMSKNLFLLQGLIASGAPIDQGAARRGQGSAS